MDFSSKLTWLKKLVNPNIKMKITIFSTFFLFVGVGVWAVHVPIKEFDNSTIHDEEILFRQERGDTNNKAYKFGMLGAACRLASF